MPDLPPATQSNHREEIAAWRAIVAQYETPHLGRACWQVVDSFVPYVLCWVAMYFTVQRSWWVTLLIAILAAGFLVRVFIIFHDCGHGSFFRSKCANAVLGFICGMLTFTPYFHWRWEHALHHGTSGDLDRRGTGDIWTLTVQEYLESSRWKRFAYRFARNPFVLFVIAPLVLFLVIQRFPSRKAKSRDRHSVWWMNFALVLMAAGMSWLFGLVPYVLIQLTIMAVAGTVGVWLFYVQHQFEGVYWERRGDWDYTSAAMKGASFYKLPKVLQWFSGNIGFHHIHHLSPRIPNYNLERCYKSHPMFQEVKPVGFFASLKSLGFRLWDEPSKKLVGFGYLRKLRWDQRHPGHRGGKHSSHP